MTNITLLSIVSISEVFVIIIITLELLALAGRLEKGRELILKIQGSESGFRKTLEDRLEMSEKQIDAYLDSAWSAVVLIDGDGIIQRWNRSSEKIFGYSRQEVRGKNITMIMPDKYIADHTNALKRLRDGGSLRQEGKTLKLEAKTKSGKIIPIKMRVNKIEADKTYYTALIKPPENLVDDDE